MATNEDPGASTSTSRRGGRLRRLLVIAAVLLVLFLDSIVRTGIETAGSRVLGVRTSVADVSIGLTSGKTAVRGLEVDNPAGYEPVKFLALGAVEVDAPLSGLMGEKIVIDRVRLADLTLELEKGADERLNVEVIVDNLKRATGAGEAPGEQPDKPAAEQKEALVKELRLEKVHVKLRNIAGGKDGVVDVELPEIVLRDLSSKGGVDVLASELSGVVIGTVMKSVIASNIEGLGAGVIGHMQGAVDGLGNVIGGPLLGAVDAGVTGAGEALKAVGEGLGDIGKGVGEGAQKMLEGAGGVLEEGAKGVGGAIEGLFGGKKK
jgi:hypothetical protein